MKINFKQLKLVFAFLVFLGISNANYAAYFKNLPQTIVQPSGEKIECFASGDEFFNFLHDANGYVIIQSQDGYFYYAVEENEDIIPSKYIVNTVNPEIVGLKKWARISNEKYIAKTKEHNKFKREKNIKSSAKSAHTGRLNNVVVYIKFSDDTEFTINRQTYDNKYNPDNSTSLKNYYKNVSYNRLYLQSYHYPICELTTNLSYTDANPRGYYKPYNASSNPTGYTSSNKTTREHTLLKNAIAFIETQVPDTLDIDNDDDGYVDNVCFVVRGNSGAWADLLWAHRWWLFSFDVQLKGKRVYDYTFQPENQNDVQTLCHEMFHALGAPDLYHYNNQGALTPAGGWDLMESGFGHMGAFMKWKYANAAWVTDMPEITTSGTYSLKPLSNPTNNCYKIQSYDPSQFYVLEYRKKSGPYEESLSGSGLLIYRINTNAGDGNAQGPPDEVYIYRPGGSNTNNGTIGSAFYSLESGRIEINENSNPTPFLYDGNYGGLNISQVSNADTTISFYVNIDSELKPKAKFKTTQAFVNTLSATSFEEYSYKNPTSWKWFFDGGNPSTSNSSNPNNITYNNNGKYNVKLIASNNEGSDTLIKYNYIHVGFSNYWTPQHLKFIEKRNIKNIYPVTINGVWAITNDDNNKSEFSISINSGLSWTSKKIKGYENCKVISFSPSSNSRAWVLLKNTIDNSYKILFTGGGGDQWNLQTAAFNSNSVMKLVHGFNSNNSIIIGNPNDSYFEIYTTTNSGTAWTRVPQANIPSPLTDEVVIENCYDAVSNSIWFATSKGRIFKSIDKGLNWTVVDTQIESIKKISFKDANNGLILAKNTSTILKTTTDGGTTWNDVAFQGPLFTTDITYVPSSEGTMISVSNDELNPGSSYSLDNGLNWFIIDDKMTYNCVAFYNSTLGYAGSYNLDEFHGGAFKWNWLTLGIENNIKTIKDNLVVVPNPTNSICSISINQAPKNVELYSITGKYIHAEITYHNGKLQIDLSNLDNGVYLINIINNQNERIVKKIIKQ